MTSLAVSKMSIGGVTAVNPGNEGWSGTLSLEMPWHSVKSLKENTAGVSGGHLAFPVHYALLRSSGSV